MGIHDYRRAVVACCILQGDYLNYSSSSALAEVLHSVPFLSAGFSVQTHRNAVGFGLWTLPVLKLIGARITLSTFLLEFQF